MSTSRSVPDVPGPGAPAVALRTSLLDALIAAAETLAKASIQILPQATLSGHRDTELCTECQRCRTYQGFVHEPTCMVGRVLVFAAAAKAAPDPVLWIIAGADLLNLYFNGYCPKDEARDYLAKVEIEWPGKMEPVPSQAAAVLQAVRGAALGAFGLSGRIKLVPEDDLASPVESERSENPMQVATSDVPVATTNAGVEAVERRVVCGAHFLGEHDPAHPMTCDKEPGHDADPLSDHWNRDARRAWPTAAVIAAETAAAR